MIDYSYLHIKNTIPFLPGFHRSHKVFTHFSFKIFLKSSSTTSGTELSASEYSTDVALFTISPDDTMTLEISVDELDINSVEIGQEAVVTFDAIEEKEFTGEVTEIGNTASVNGGVAKYTVSVSVPKDEEMKQGMNASATITIENRENVITIPVNALQEVIPIPEMAVVPEETVDLAGAETPVAAVRLRTCKAVDEWTE